MLKMIYAWKDHPDRTPEECEAHYRKVHMVLARRLYDGVPGFGALVYNRVRDSFVNDHNRPGRVEADRDVDAWVELYFHDRASFEATAQTLDMRPLFDDHENFMAVDVPASVRVYEVDETVFYGSRPPEAT